MNSFGAINQLPTPEYRMMAPAADGGVTSSPEHTPSAASILFVGAGRNVPTTNAAVGPSQSEPTAAPFPFRNGAKPVNQTSIPMLRITYTCQCEREGFGTPAAPPIGWRLLTKTYEHGWLDTPQCPDCIAFATSVSGAEPDRTHDSSSAVNDDEPAVIALRAYHPDNIKRPAPRIGNLWQATLIFHDDKGVVESKVIIASANPLDASDLLRAMVPSYRIADLVSIIITPPPVNVLG